MATIYLEQRKDKRMYTACYKQLVDNNPCGMYHNSWSFRFESSKGHTQLLLGDAFMKIQEPSKAIAVYETALKQDPRNSNRQSIKYCECHFHRCLGSQNWGRHG